MFGGGGGGGAPVDDVVSRARFAPQFAQNFASSASVVPHFGQFIGVSFFTIGFLA